MNWSHINNERDRIELVIIINTKQEEEVEEEEVEEVK